MSVILGDWLAGKYSSFQLLVYDVSAEETLPVTRSLS